jgi:UDP-N-acetylglucosamine 4-epimerase
VTGTWLVTGSAGFIGSNLCARILAGGGNVIGLDNFSTGKRENVDRVMAMAAGRYRFVEGDVCDRQLVHTLHVGVDTVVHLAAQASVQKSFADVAHNNRQNIDGFVSVLTAAGELGVSRFIYASSCAVYGDTEDLPIRESQCPHPLSPYASSKLMNDLLAKNLRHLYPRMRIAGLRFFNIFGPWQDPHGAYAAVIPRWIDRCISGQQPIVFGDGSATRDFCYVGNVCDLVIRIGNGRAGEASGVYNVASGQTTSLTALCATVLDVLRSRGVQLSFDGPEHKPWNEGDIVHSLGDIGLAARVLGFDPVVGLRGGIEALLNEQYTL